MSAALAKLYPITDTSVSGLSNVEQVRALSAGGASIIQLRAKNLSSLDFYEQAKAALEITRRHGAKLIINDRVDIARAIDAEGVHLGQHDLPVESARELLGPEAIIGISTHSIPQILEAIKLPVSYIALGPIFPTATKGHPDPVVGLGALREARRVLKSLPLVAIGGITQKNAQEVILAGANSVAVIGALAGNRATTEFLTREFLGILEAPQT